MVKGSTKISKKGEHSSKKSEEKQEQKLPSTTQLPEIDTTNFNEITVTIESYQNMVPAYRSSYIFSKIQFGGIDLGESPKILLTDDPILLADHEFKLKYNTESLSELDKLITNPLIVKIFQFPNLDSEIFVEDTSKSEEDKLILDQSLSSVESAISLYEALTGDTVEKVDFLASPSREKKLKAKGKKNGKKEKKGNKNSSTTKSSGNKHAKKSNNDSKTSQKSSKKGSKTSHKKGVSKESIGKTTSKAVFDATEKETGVCILDLMPFIFEKSSFTEFLQLIVPEPFCDDRMIRYSYPPGIVVTVSIEKPLTFTCKPKLLNITFDSIYNIPSIMNEEMEYHLCLTLPSVDQTHQYILIKDGNYSTFPERINHKQWPNISKDYANVTLYRADYDPNTIKNYVDKVELQNTFERNQPRIEFNLIKRNVLLKDGFLAFFDHIRKFRRVVLEIHAFKKTDETVPESSKKSKSKSKVKEVTSVETTGNEKLSPYLHLMAVLELSSLLYPGVTKTKIAIPITTFHEQEAHLYGGLENSYFFPPAVKVFDKSTSKVIVGKKDKKERSKSKESKKSKGSKDTKKSKKAKESKKKKTEKIDDEDLNLKSKLPPTPTPEPPPEPSIKLYDEHGNPTFIVLEIELTESLIERRKIDDLHNSLREVVQIKPPIPKVVFDNQAAIKLCRNILQEIIKELNRYYTVYTEQKSLCFCEKQADFITYMKRCGIYQNYLLTLMQISSFIASFKLNLLEESMNQQQHQNFVEDIFRRLITETNETLHKMTVIGRNTVKLPKTSFNSVLFFAQEATEIGNLDLADKYYLEILHHGSKNADHWFNYAVFNLQRGQFEKAFMCLQEALSRKIYHKNSLLLNGILLAEKRRLVEAELCLLTTMVHQPRWVEGWVVLYLFYKDVENEGGMDLSLEMALKFLDDPRYKDDAFSKREDLIWTSSICPKTIYFKASILLLKMRAYSWVENALACELKHTGIVHYMLAVICYYRKRYEHSLEHLEKARFFHGSDYPVVSLTGHCYLALGKPEQALYEYLQVLQSFERPDDMHLLYINCAEIMDNIQEARKILLIACKNHPTPYTWMACGIAYLAQNDLLSAEECFSESVLLNNSVGVCWGYLALINLKMRHISEAELCYGLALKHNINDTELVEKIKHEAEKLKSPKNSVFFNTFM